MTRKSAAIVIVTVLTALALALVPGALAGRGGSGTGASIAFDPQAVAVNQRYQVKISGLRPDTLSTVGAYYIASDAAYWCSGMSDGAGNFSCAFTAWKSGDILHEAHQKGNNNRYRLKASAYLTVSP